MLLLPGDVLATAEKVGALLKQRREKIAVAESSAGGLLAASLLTVPGASAYFLGGAVVYTKPARSLMMGITDLEMTGMRSSSEPYAMMLARTSRQRYESDWGLAETGASGPSGNSYGDAPGHTCVAVSGAGFEKVKTIETGNDDRLANMHAFVLAALELMKEALERT